MSDGDTVLAELLAGNERHSDGLADDHFDGVRDAQHPRAVTVCCSDSRVPQRGMFSVEEAGGLFTPSTIGNQVWDRVDGERVVEGSLQYPVAYAGTEVAAVVGHTGCGAVTAALDAVHGEAPVYPPGVRKWVAELEPVVADGLANERVDPDREVGLVDQLVEYNVDRQVAFLRDADAFDGVAVYGFVYDFHRTHGGVDGRTYLVNADGETDPAALRERASYIPDRRQARPWPR